MVSSGYAASPPAPGVTRAEWIADKEGVQFALRNAAGIE